MHFQIYIPGVRGCDPQHLEEVGLATLAASANFVGCDKGPDGQSGSVIFWKHTAKGTIGYLPEKQDWLPAIADAGRPAGRYWIGFTQGADPTPEDLQRPYRHVGELLTFGDGQGWMLPQLYKLPHDMIRVDDGTWKFELQRQFHDLWLEARQVQPVLQATEIWTRDLFATLAEFVLHVLQLNYRLTPEVVNRLRLFTAGDSGTVVLAAALVCAQLDGGGA